MRLLKGLFQNKYILIYLVHPPGIRASSILISFNNFLTDSLICPTKVSEAKSFFQREKEPITLFRYSKVSSSFIQPFEDDATTQQCLKFSHNAAASRLAPWKTTNRFIFVLSAFAVKQTLTHTFRTF